jgi:hypothetical protein
MANCNKCKSNRCGCGDSALSVPATFSNCPTVCPPDSEKCTELVLAECVCWPGPDICELDVKTGDRLDEIFRKLILTVSQISCKVGLPGETGASAYEEWLSYGNVGTEQEFLASLIGTDGTNGIASLTTDGTSGLSTLIGGILNIPDYGDTSLGVADQTLTGNRTVTMAGFDLLFTSTGDPFMLFLDAPAGNVGIGHAPSEGKLDVDGRITSRADIVLRDNVNANNGVLTRNPLLTIDQVWTLPDETGTIPVGPAWNSLIANPTATEDTYAIKWNNTNAEYELVAELKDYTIVHPRTKLSQNEIAGISIIAPALGTSLKGATNPFSVEINRIGFLEYVNITIETPPAAAVGNFTFGTYVTGLTYPSASDYLGGSTGSLSMQPGDSSYFTSVICFAWEVLPAGQHEVVLRFTADPVAGIADKLLAVYLNIT